MTHQFSVYSLLLFKIDNVVSRVTKHISGTICLNFYKVVASRNICWYVQSVRSGRLDRRVIFVKNILKYWKQWYLFSVMLLSPCFQTVYFVTSTKRRVVISLQALVKVIKLWKYVGVAVNQWSLAVMKWCDPLSLLPLVDKTLNFYIHYNFLD